MTVSNLMKMAESYLNGQKTLWEKEKLLVTSNFSFSHSVFKIIEPQTRKNQGLFGKGLKCFSSFLRLVCAVSERNVLKMTLTGIIFFLAGQLAQLIERRTREHNVSGHYRCGFVSPSGQLKLLIVFRMRC